MKPGKDYFQDFEGGCGWDDEDEENPHKMMTMTMMAGMMIFGQ